MTSITQRYDDIPEDFVPRFPLPVLPKPGIGSALHAALDSAATLRQILPVYGHKGMGKSVMLDIARAWFQEREALRHARNHAYQAQTMVLMRNLRQASYDDAIEMLVRLVDRQHPVRIKGRKVRVEVLKEQLAVLILRKRVTVIAVDETEYTKEAVINAVRDVAAMSADYERTERGIHDRQVPMGTGVVLVGTPALDRLVKGSEEEGQRILTPVRLPALTIAEAAEVLKHFLPQAQRLEAGAMEMFHHMVRVSVCRERETVYRHLVNIVLEYARRLDRARQLTHARGWEDVPLDPILFAAIAKEATPPDLDGGRGGRGKRA